MLKIMLVEDDNNLREIYEARLQAEGYTVVSARDGEEGLVVAKSEKPDLLIADVMMPKISGFEMLDILRNTDGLKEVKVIMLTALGQSDDQERADSLGADRYLVKSQVTLEDIIKATHELLEDAPAPTVAATEPVLYIATPALAETQPIVPISEVFKSEVIEQSPAIEQPAMPQTTSQEQDELKTEIESFVSRVPAKTPQFEVSTPAVADHVEDSTFPSVSGISVKPTAATVASAITDIDTKAMDDEINGLIVTPSVPAMSESVTPITTVADQTTMPSGEIITPTELIAESIQSSHGVVIEPAAPEIVEPTSVVDAPSVAAPTSIPVIDIDTPTPETTIEPPAPDPNETTAQTPIDISQISL